MGLIKRLFRQTSHRLLGKLGHSHGVEHAFAAHHHMAMAAVSSPLPSQLAENGGKRASSRRKRIGLKSLKESSSSSSSANANNKTAKKGRNSHSHSIPEALLLAAKNYLPPVQFHHVHGPNVELTRNNYVARRTQGFCQALVFSNRIILPNERVYIKVLEIARGWSGTIRFGFTSVDPATLRCRMPKHACPDMTNAGHTWARALADEVVRRNSVIHFSYTANGYIHYGINNQDCGIFYANVNTSNHLWFIVDIYGLTAAVELIDPRVHNAASSEAEFSRMDAELSAGLRMMKKKQRSRNSNWRHSRTAAVAYEQWPPEGLFMTTSSPIGLDRSQNPILPNLSSIILPAQQNIYSPMPGVPLPTNPVTSSRNLRRLCTSSRTLNEPHDYYQIMTDRMGHHDADNSQLPLGTMSVARSAADRSRLTKQQSAAASSSSSSSSSSPTSSSSNTPNTSASTLSPVMSRDKSLSTPKVSDDVRSTVHPSDRRLYANDEQEICHQLDGLQMSNLAARGQPKQQTRVTSTNKPLKSTTNNSVAPVAAARRRLRSSNPISSQNDYATNSKALSTEITHQPIRPSPNSSTRLNSSSASGKSSNLSQLSGSTRKPRSSTNTAASNNNGNVGPTTKDCPICFERPINCVLYQCGHMCTCFECGVKQWRTQSRTCPICRTVIKDVIKTYMS